MANALNLTFSRKNLEIVWRYEKQRLTRSCFGVDRQTGREFGDRLPFEFHRLRERTAKNFKPDGLLAIAKPKDGGGHRIICVPTIADRVIQFALLMEIRPKLAARGLLNSISYGLIRGEGKGVREARTRAIALRSINPWVYKADIQKFFDNIPREAVKLVASKVVGQRSLHQVMLPFIDTEIEDGFDSDWKTVVAQAGIVSNKGVRQGMPLSPYFAGLILRDLDRKIERSGTPAIRYVDDIVAFFSTREECEAFDVFLREALSEIQLSIGQIGAEKSKVAIYGPTEAAEFLGMQIAHVASGKYVLRIGADCLEKIGNKFVKVSSVSSLLNKGITLPLLGGHLLAMERGYIQAYEGAQNHGDLIAEVKKMKALALSNVLEELFGELLGKFSRQERRFLGLE